MPSSFKLDQDSIKGFSERIERSEKRFLAWRQEARLFRGLFVNDYYSWSSIAPGGNPAPNYGRSKPTTVCRNSIGSNVMSDMRRLTFRNIRLTASPLVSKIEHNGQLVDGATAAYSQGEALTYGFREINFTTALASIIEDGLIANEGWAKIVTRDGADAAETPVWVDPDSGEKDQAGKRSKIKPQGPCNSLANFRFPGVIWCDVEDVIVDPDAVTWEQINWIAHRVKKPLSNMRTQMIDDPNGEIDPLTGVIKKVKKYKNLENLNGNFNYYQERMSRGNAGEADTRNDASYTDMPATDYLVYYEVHCRFPADSKIILDANGGVAPKTIDGFVYYMLDLVEVTPGVNGEDATEIRWQEYPVDLGGYALIRWQPRIISGSQKGFSNIRDYYEASALENYWASYLTHYLAAVKPTKIADKSSFAGDEKAMKQVQEMGHFGTIMVDVTGNKTIRDSIYTTEFPPPPQEVFAMYSTMRKLADEGSGRSANQMGSYSGNDPSAKEVGVVQQNATEQNEYYVESLKTFVGQVAKPWLRALAAMLPENGRSEIPGSDGTGFVQFDNAVFGLLCAFQVDPASEVRDDNPVKAEQVMKLMIQIAQTPPNLWQPFMPLWEYQATTFSPALLGAFRKFRDVVMKGPGNTPDALHLLLREGIWVEPDPNQDFVKNLPEHQKMLATVTTDPRFADWNEPVQSEVPQQNGQVPRQLLAKYIAISEKIATDKGMAPLLGLSGDKAGAARKERGSGPDSGRMPQGGAPTEAALETGAMA